MIEIPRRVLEHELEESLHRWYCEQPFVLSVRRQHRWPGTNQRADLIVWRGLPDGSRCIDIVEVKAGAANMETVRQSLRYWRLLKRNLDPNTTAHITLAAPRFTDELVEWIDMYDPNRSLFALLGWGLT